jgi:hypothetical protein
MINRQNMAAWVAALRSGKYTQAAHYLRVNDVTTGQPRHCCLGVACEVYVEATGFPVDFGGGLLPPAVAEWLGLDNMNPTVGVVAYEQSDEDGDISSPIRATHANDSLRWSFENIADGIEGRYLA